MPNINSLPTLGGIGSGLNGGAVAVFVGAVSATGRVVDATIAANSGNVAPTALYHVLHYWTSGAPASVGVRIDSSADSGATWSVISSTETATTASMIAAYGAGTNFTVNVTSLSAGGTLNFKLCSYETPPPGLQVVYSPALLGMSALAVGAGITVTGSKVDCRGARSLTIEATATQTFEIAWQPYDETGGTTFGNPVSIITALAANALVVVNEAQALAQPTATSGTLAATNATVGLPARTMAPAIKNTSVSAGTCTVRVIVQY